MRDKYIFLDIDGVLNTAAEWKTPFVLNPRCLQNFQGFLKKMQKNYAIHIILTSTWKNSFRGNLHSPDYFSPLIRCLNDIGLRVNGLTQSVEGRSRGEEVLRYAKEHEIAEKDCLVIDDDRSLFEKDFPVKTIWTDAKKGFTESVV